MDSLAVSVTSGIAIKKLYLRHAFVIGLFFGSFQALMPLIGWMAGFNFVNWVKNIDHWIACIILCILGIKMIHESTKLEEKTKVVNPMEISVLLILSIATSIDALAVGISLSFLQISIITPIIIIGIVTFVLSFFGTFVGNKFGHLLENKIEIAGGLMLIGIGLKILIEHLFFS